MAADRAHLTIGEVLSLLRQEFPDISISKIRFLESQGLVDPERTPSGYRKFYDHDVARLRWILQQQREHFLPLKVIRGRLFDPDATSEDGAPSSSSEASTSPGPAVSPGSAGGGEVVALVATGELVEALEVAPAVAAAPPEGGTDPSALAPPVAARQLVAPAPAQQAVAPAPAPAPAEVAAQQPVAPAAAEVAAQQPVAPAAAEVAAPQPVASAPVQPAAASSGQPDVYTAEELAEAAGCETRLVEDLCQYGLLVANASVAGVAYFDRDSVALVQTAARFAAVGVEPRHLRSWRNAADREASLFEQLVTPLLRQRNPQARRQAAALLDELAELGAQLRAELMREAIRSIR